MSKVRQEKIFSSPMLKGKGIHSPSAQKILRRKFQFFLITGFVTL
jgi:hypothetical protein